MICSIIPPYVLQRLSQAEDPQRRSAAEAARRALAELPPLYAARSIPGGLPPRSLRPEALPGLHREVADAQGRETLPGIPVRSEGDAPIGDAAVDEAYDGLGATYSLFADEYGRAPVEGSGAALEATVHYGTGYDNAFWNGSRMVFGDGDGEVFVRFTRSLSVIGHELSHGFTQLAAQLAYRDQAGAVNESLSDVFGCLVEQRQQRQDAAAATWLVGAGLFTPAVSGVALRSLKAPGTAYDDDVLGRDPQPAFMDGYVRTESDNGGVHINSGIPNHAFYLLASSLGGFAWERAGQIWFDTVTEQQLPPDCTFSVFAAATLTAAEKRYGPASTESTAVQRAWDEVGVILAQ